jgi:hypothetical protein
VSRCRPFAVAISIIGALATAAPASASFVFGDRPLRQGMQGHEVRVLQGYLTRVGVRMEVDGRYGPVTARRVRRWERRSGRREDGRVSRRDAAVLRRQVEQGGGVVAPTPDAPPVSGNPTEKATLNTDGTANPPDSAPQAVKDLIYKANEIVGKPYLRGGGHRHWADDEREDGVDCSGAVSVALHGGGLLDAPVTSGDLMTWEQPRKGDWITVYAHQDHVYMVVAQLRFDTGWHSFNGPRWTNKKRPSRGFERRHPAGL